MKHLIIGQGEIGSALHSILKCDIRDIENTVQQTKYDCIHICYPYSNNFCRSVKKYRRQYNPKYVVVHSTVPVGTCRKLDAIHSPVIGVHPHLAESILTFKKVISSRPMAKELEKFGIKTVYVKKSEDSEAGKLYSLLIYGINVLLEKEIFDYCKVGKLDYDSVYNLFVSIYNEGYKKMGMEKYTMYKLQHREGPIGGHCVVQNGPRLGTAFAKILATLNRKYKK